MSERKILITDFDRKRLMETIREAYRNEYRESVYLKNLLNELERATLVESHEIPADVITMNSKIRLLDLDENEMIEFTLVFPQEADTRQAKVSVLAPLGTAVLGYRLGDTIRWEVPDGVRSLKVVALLYQPESAGDYQL